MERGILKGTIDARECLGVVVIHLITGSPCRTGVRNGPSAQHEVKHASKVADQGNLVLGFGGSWNLPRPNWTKSARNPPAIALQALIPPSTGGRGRS